MNQANPIEEAPRKGDVKMWLKNPQLWLSGFLLLVVALIVYGAFSGSAPPMLMAIGWIQVIGLFITAVLIIATSRFIWLFTQPTSSERTVDEKLRVGLVRFSYSFMFVAITAVIVPFFLLDWEEDASNEKVTQQPRRRPMAVLIGCSMAHLE